MCVIMMWRNIGEIAKSSSCGKVVHNWDGLMYVEVITIAIYKHV